MPIKLSGHILSYGFGPEHTAKTSRLLISLLGHWLSDEPLPFLRLAVIGLLFPPYLWSIPIVGAIAGNLLARRIAPEPTHPPARLQHAVQPLVLSIAPLFTIVGIAQCFPP